MLNNRIRPHRQRQSGVFMIEALVAILVFSLGILAMVGTGTVSVTAQSDARFRTEAARLAADLTQDIYLNVNLAAPADLPTALAAFQHQPTTGGAGCTFTGTASVSPVVTNWVTKVSGSGGLPGSSSTMQQVVVNTGAGGYNQVTVSICWQAPSDSGPRKHTYTAFIN